MVDFRKWFPALAIVALLLGSAVAASAQTSPFACTVAAGVPPLLRAEGITELVGDIVLTCTGGTPTPAGSPVPGVNVQVFLNTNVTSRIVGSNNQSEAMLMIDEPGTTINVGGTPTLLLRNVCSPTASGVCTVTGNGASGVVIGGTAFPGGVAYGLDPVVPNIYLGTWGGSGAPNTVSWLGVPIDPPGTVGTRVIRITNVRGNASQLGVSSTLVPSQLVGFISLTSPTAIPVTNPQQILGFVTRGLTFSVGSPDPSATGRGRTLQQCVGNNANIAGDPSRDLQQGVTFRGIFAEGFASSFKRRSWTPGDLIANADGTFGAGALTRCPGTTCGTYSADSLNTGAVALAQAQPGQNLFTESGFYLNGIATGATGTATAAVPTGATIAGLADHGTRLMMRLSGIPSGAQVFANLYEQGANATNSRVRLISTDANGAGSATAVAQTDTSTVGGVTFFEAPVTVTGGAATIVYEVVSSDPFVAETIRIPVFVAFAASSPGLGTANVIGSFAPISTVTVASQTAPIPRFADVTTSSSAFTINPCRTNLLFPFVTNQAGFDTGIAISNTSLDIYSASSDQAGPCRVHYFGSTTGGGAAPATQTTSAALPAGGQLTFVVSSGGTLGFVGTPGFQGYIIAQCDFQYGHGFAFITDGPIGAARVAEGYLALVIDDGISSRAENNSETLGN